MAVAKHMLRYLDTGNLVKMGCSRMPKESGVELFIDAVLIGGGAEDILRGSL
jgi:hypothetical protein